MDGRTSPPDREVGEDRTRPTGQLIRTSTTEDQPAVLLGDAESNTFYVGGILCGRVRSDDRVAGNGGAHYLTLTAIENLDDTGDCRDTRIGNSADNVFMAGLRAPGDHARE